MTRSASDNVNKVYTQALAEAGADVAIIGTKCDTVEAVVQWLTISW